MGRPDRAQAADPLAWAIWNRERRTNLPQLLRERAQATPDEVFAFLGDDRLTYGELHARSLAWSGVLQTEGVRPGDHVLTFLEPAFDGYALWLGLAWLGAVDVPINPAYRGPVLAHAINMADARLAVVSASFLPRICDVHDEAPKLQTIIVKGEGAVATDHRLRLVPEAYAFASSPAATALVEPQPHDIACIIFTSGTTGPAKAVLVPWGQMIAQSYLGRRDMHNEDLYNMNGDSVFYAYFPVFHMSGRYALNLALARGARIAYRPVFSVENFWSDIDRYGGTHTQLLAPMMAFLMMKPEGPEDRRHSLSAIIAGPVGDVMTGFMRRYGVRARTSFGMTEIGGPIGTAWMSADDPPASCGVPVEGPPGIELRIVDENDYPVAPGESGELIVRASEPWALNAGYYKMPAETAAAWRNGWFHTGDVFRVDEAGEYHFVDRRKDCIRRRGENISSFEVEAYVAAHPAVQEVAAVPHPSAYGNGEDEVKIWVVLRSGAEADPRAIHDWLADRMPKYMLPRFIDIVEALPKTEATQRVQKAQLKGWGNSAATWDAGARA
jgi:carnitine-CoA ligase